MLFDKSVLATGNTVFKGGLLGFKYFENGMIAASFWDIQTSGLASSVGGLGLTTHRCSMHSIIR